MNPVSPKVSAVILNVYDMPGLVECLRSLDKTSYENFEIIIVHNGPGNNEFEKEVRHASAKISEVVFTGFNSGFSAGNNAGIRRAMQRGADYVLLLNDDTVVAPDFLGLLVEQARKDPAIGMAGPRIMFFSVRDKIWFSGARFNMAECVFLYPGTGENEAAYGHFQPVESDYITGCAVLVSKKLIETVGLLDERFFLYWEDADWGLRAAAAGFKNMLVPASKVWHKVSASSGGNDSPLKIYHKTRSHLIFACSHCPRSVTGLAFRFMRDAAWLVLKSGTERKFVKAAAYLAGAAAYFTGRIGPGPDWLRTGG